MQIMAIVSSYDAEQILKVKFNLESSHKRVLQANISKVIVVNRHFLIFQVIDIFVIDMYDFSNTKQLINIMYWSHAATIFYISNHKQRLPHNNPVHIFDAVFHSVISYASSVFLNPDKISLGTFRFLVRWRSVTKDILHSVVIL